MKQQKRQKPVNRNMQGTYPQLTLSPQPTSLSPVSVFSLRSFTAWSLRPLAQSRSPGRFTDPARTLPLTRRTIKVLQLLLLLLFVSIRKASSVRFARLVWMWARAAEASQRCRTAAVVHRIMNAVRRAPLWCDVMRVSTAPWCCRRPQRSPCGRKKCFTFAC